MTTSTTKMQNLQLLIKTAQNTKKEAEENLSIDKTKELFLLARTQFNEIYKYLNDEQDLKSERGILNLKAEILLNLAEINNILAKIFPKERDEYLAIAAKKAILGLKFSQNDISKQILNILSESIVSLAKKYVNNALSLNNLEDRQKYKNKIVKLYNWAKRIAKNITTSLPLDKIESEMKKLDQ